MERVKGVAGKVFRLGKVVSQTAKPERVATILPIFPVV